MEREAYKKKKVTGINEWSTPHSSEHWPIRRPAELKMISTELTRPAKQSALRPMTGRKKRAKKKIKGTRARLGPSGEPGARFFAPPAGWWPAPPPPPGGHFFGQFWGLFFQARAPTAAHCARLAAWRSTSFLVGILCLADRQNSLPFLLWAQPPVPQKTSKNIPCCAVQNESLFFLQLLAYCSTLCST